MQQRGKNRLIQLIVLTIFVLACSKESPPSISVQDFEILMDENPDANQSLGFVSVEFLNTDKKTFYFDQPNRELAKHLYINNTSGEISIINPSYFDYETNPISFCTAVVEATNSDGAMDSEKFMVFIELNDSIELSVQGRLDTGETPHQIFLTNNSYLDSLYGKWHLDGYIFYFDQNTGKGLVTKRSSSEVWDPNTYPEVTGATSTAFGDGEINTALIISIIGPGSYAANFNFWSDDGWFLPSLDELKEIYSVRHSIPVFQVDGNFWSSSEFDKEAAWTFGFNEPNGQNSALANKTIERDLLLIKPY